MTDFSTMQDRIGREIQRDGITADIAAAISDAIDHYRAERFGFNYGTASVQLTASSGTMAFPANLVEIERLELSASSGSPSPYRVNGPDDWEAVQSDFLDANNNVQTPTRFAVRHGEIQFDAPADDNYNAQVWFLKDLAEVSLSASDAATNAWMTVGERMVRAKAKEFLYEDRLNNPRRAGRAALRAESERRKLKQEIPTTDQVVPTRF